jgi:hypothetical protein
VNVTNTVDGYLEVSWDASNDNVTKYYLVYRGTNQDFVPDETSSIAQTDDNSIIDMDITGSTYYYYKVAGVNDENVSGQPSAPAPGRGQLDKIVKDITEWCFIGIAILIALFIVYNGLIFDKHEYVISFDGNPTFIDEKISGIINNTKINNTNTYRTVTIYGINSSIQPLVHSTNLTNNDSNMVIHLAASLLNISETAKSTAGNANQIILGLNPNEIKPGSFDGLLTVYDTELHSISVRLATANMLIQSVIIIGFGILISIITWEWIKYYRKNNSEQQRQILLDRTRKARDNEVFYQEQFNRLQPELEYLKYQVLILQPQINDINNAEFQETIERRNRLEKQATKLKSMEIASRIAMETNRQAAAISGQKVDMYKARNLHRSTTYGKIIATELGSAVFGITLALFGLLTNDHIMGLRSIDTIEFAVLFGLGLGIGSLKEFVDK